MEAKEKVSKAENYEEFFKVFQELADSVGLDLQSYSEKLTKRFCEDEYIYECTKCKKVLSGDFMGKRCQCGESTYEHMCKRRKNLSDREIGAGKSGPAFRRTDVKEALKKFIDWLCEEDNTFYVRKYKLHLFDKAEQIFGERLL